MILRALLVLSGLLMAGCPSPVEIRNVSPRVSYIGAAVPSGIDQLQVRYWLQDHEEDPVDIVVRYMVGADPCATLKAQTDDPAHIAPDEDSAGMVPAAAGAGGHHTVGLETRKNYPGMPHEISWSTQGLAADTTVCVFIVPYDRHGARGDPSCSASFQVGTGFEKIPPPEAPGSGAADAGPTDAGTGATAG